MSIIPKEKRNRNRKFIININFLICFVLFGDGDLVDEKKLFIGLNLVLFGNVWTYMQGTLELIRYLWLMELISFISCNTAS